VSAQISTTMPEKPTKQQRPRGRFELSLKFGGVELTIKGWQGLATLAVSVLVATALAQELRLPPARRTWHGNVYRYVPYDFRLPTLSRLRDSMWDPKNPHLFTDKPLGIGWNINLARLRSAITS
jgi:hypothetical protein